MANIQVYQEGGWGWFVVLCAFMSDFVIFGSIKAFGVLLTPMKEDLDTDLWVIGSIAALHYGMQFVLTPIASIIAQKLGGRCVIIFGGILYGLGLVLSTTTYSIAFLAVALVLIAGTGAACTNEISRAEMAFYFHEKYAMASCIVYMGAPIGMMLYGPVTQTLLDIYGWRGAMLLIGGVGFHLISAGALVRRPTGMYAIIPREGFHTDDECSDDAQPNSVQRTNDQPPAKCGNARALGLDMFLNLDFMIVACTRICYCIVAGGVMVYMVSNGLSLGLSPRQTSFLTTAYGVGSLAGLFLGALASHTKVLSLHVTAALAASVAAVSLALEPVISSFVGQMVNTCIITVGVSCVIQVVSVMTRFLPYPDDRFVIVLGWLGFLGGLAASIADTISGWIYEATRTFHGTFFLYSAIMVACTLCLTVNYIRIRYIKRYDSRY